MARDESKKFKVAPELMSTDTGLARPGILMRTRKETSECEVRAALIRTESTEGPEVDTQPLRCAWEPRDPGRTPEEKDRGLVFRDRWLPLDYLHDSCF